MTFATPSAADQQAVADKWRAFTAIAISFVTMVFSMSMVFVALSAIAADFGISRRTVEAHRESLMRKLEIHSVAGLTRFALEVGLAKES